MRYLLYILLAAAAVLILLLLAALIRTLLAPVKTSAWKPEKDGAREDAYAKKLSRMVQYETESHPGKDEREKFLGFHRVLEDLFPLVHQKLEKTEID